MKIINWGFIGCGNVTEIKSGPAFSKISGSRILAVTRRNTQKARDYARRHKIPVVYKNAAELLKDPKIDAVYIATPPSTHAFYTIQAARAGKHIYVEKPMACTVSESQKMIRAAQNAGISLFVAYYRRSLPLFIKVKELIDSEILGQIRLVNIRLYKPVTKTPGFKTQLPWRYKPEIAGAGLFFDLASHQLDFIDYLFGPIESIQSQVANQAGLYQAEDIISVNFRFRSGIFGNGIWCFTVSEVSRLDQIEIIGSKGQLSFSTFDFTPLKLKTLRGIKSFRFRKPKHVQKHLIKSVVDELLNRGKCPSNGVSAARTTWVMEQIVRNYYHK